MLRETVNYHGWPNTLRLFNDSIEMIVTTDVGPRILHFGFVGGENELGVNEDLLGVTGGDEWRPFGGHRLWHAPESIPRTYAPDNRPVAVEDHGSFVRLLQPVEAATGIEKELDIFLSPDQPRARIVHRLRSRGLWPVALAPWAITVMNTQGTAIMPLPPRGPHAENLLPTGTIAIWAYTAMSDPRWTWGYKYVLLRQDPSNPYLQKAGLMASDGWIAYARNNHLFVKVTRPIVGAAYPDLGCTIEAYVDANILEVETLGPLVMLEPGQSTEHTEWWHLFDNVPRPESDDDVDAHIRPKIDALLGE